MSAKRGSELAPDLSSMPDRGTKSKGRLRLAPPGPFAGPSITR